MKLTIGHLYPDLLNLYGDRGNIQCFRKRLEWRGIEAEVIPFLSGDKIDFSCLDIVLLGGGSDREQELVCGYLKDIRDDFKQYVEKGGVVLAVCGGYQLLGKYYKTQTKTIEGLAILDITTEWEPERLIRVGGSVIPENFPVILQNQIFTVLLTGKSILRVGSGQRNKRLFVGTDLQLTGGEIQRQIFHVLIILHFFSVWFGTDDR